MGARRARRMAQIQATFVWHVVSLGQIADATCCHNIVPTGMPAARARHHMIEGQVLNGEAGGTILAGKSVAQENIESSKGRSLG